MFRRWLVIIVFILLFAASSAAQQTRAKYGPVVRAYLTGLAEELNELEYQIKHDEISRADYERAKQRLIILRRFVERRAAANAEDLVPEFQILADYELKTLGLGSAPTPDQLVPGAEFEGQWRLAGIERSSQSGQSRKPKYTRFFVFERLAQQGTASHGFAVPERKRSRALDLEAIETVIVQQRRPEPETPRPQTVAAAIIPPPPAVGSETSAPPQSKVQLPQILRLYLPEYTRKAREKKIEGDLIVRALFARDRKIKEIKVEKGLGAGLDQRATDAVKRIGFLPALVEGRYADAKVEIVFSFKLEKVSVSVRAAGADVMAKEVRP
jgi:TonB family protein